ncbi:GNAT family N-acetyltransferase [Corynebacterium timonense]|uniref:Ribosomal protein S18 acetylase RimI n=1 Tax=Corynebacterium timonense TaxID=441500 RepID=A0A1H1QKQ1_9CORY|nr:GNAT family N-acetyltransferase [Corynebacterium timonense]SDS23479.1 Ribosomal protein S18 acetylase RimI [Corynebacterium timonense]
MTTLRHATPADKQAVIDVWDASGITQEWNDPPRDFDNALATPTCAVIVAEGEGGIEAAIIAGYDGHMGWIHMTGVLPSCQGRGIGRLLAEGAQEFLREQGADTACLMIAPGNDNGVAFWERVGFHQFDAPVWGLSLNGEGA